MFGLKIINANNGIKIKKMLNRKNWFIFLNLMILKIIKRNADKKQKFTIKGVEINIHTIK
tara:strand:+ start:233 stop:412 length:180 start_codon:yes stop_codon:yes gene_type:complete